MLSQSQPKPDNRTLAKEVISRLRIKIEGSLDRSEEWKCHCPFHKDRTPSMFVNPDKFIYHCFACHQAGSLYSLYHQITGGSLNKDLGIAFDAFSTFSLTPRYEEPDYTKLDESIAISIQGQPVSVLESPLAIKYLRKRGISIAIAQQMGMQFLETGKINGTYFENRIIIPIKEEGKIISMEGRDVTGSAERKVLYPRGSSVATLYDIDNLQKNAPLYVVEGLMDLAVLRSDEYFKNSTALFGASISRRQLFLLEQFDDVVIIPDADEAGKKSIQRLKEGLKKPFKILEVPKLGIKDVGDIPQKLHTTVEALRKRGWGRTMKLSQSLIFY